MKEKLENLKKLLDSTDFDTIIPVHREDLEAVVKLAEQLFGVESAAEIIERFDGVADRYRRTLGRQVGAINAAHDRIQAGIAVLALLQGGEKLPKAQRKLVDEALQKLRGA